MPRSRPLIPARSSPSAALRVPLPDGWLSPEQFETLVAAHDYIRYLAAGGAVTIVFPLRSAVPAGLGLWLLSFLNQLAEVDGGVLHLEFETPDGLFGYLDRNGFLQLLSPRISTTPRRPRVSSAEVFRGRTQGLVEIVPLLPGVSGQERTGIVRRLVRGLIDFYPSGAEHTRRLRNHVFTVLGELVDNVFSHSGTELPGYVSLQAYDKQRRPRVQIGVSDSGVGIPASIRETLGARVRGKSDAELVVQAFREGLSRHGANAGRGCGLPQCASLAARYGSTVHVRTPSAQVILRPAGAEREFHQADVTERVGVLSGTHVYLEFRVA